MRLPGLLLRLGTGDVFDATQRKQISEFSGIEDKRCPDRSAQSIFQVFQRDALNDVSGDLSRNWNVSKQNAQPRSTDVRSQHGTEHSPRNARFMAQRRHPSSAGIKKGIVAPRRGDRIVSTIVGPDAVAKAPICSRTAKSLDPTMFIGGYGLCRQLPTDPVGFLREYHSVSRADSRQSGGASAKTSTDHQDIRLQVMCHTDCYNAIVETRQRLLLATLAMADYYSTYAASPSYDVLDSAVIFRRKVTQVRSFRTSAAESRCRGNFESAELAKRRSEDDPGVHH
jgi:hypothetical protein